MTALRAVDVAGALVLPDTLASWLTSLELVGPPEGGAHLPRNDEAAELLRRLGVDESDLGTLCTALPDPGEQPELWWLFERACHQVLRSIGEWDAATRWPSLPDHLGIQGRCFWLFVFLAAAPAVHAWHAARGIGDDISWDTLADVGRHVGRYRRRSGALGLDSQFWLGLHFRGALYALGRLQFNPYRLAIGPAGPLFWYAGAEAPRPELAAGEPALGVHVPAGSRLDPAACDASFGMAASFFSRHFPDHASRVATCTSWLLDEQLAEYLPPTSNIVRFQRRFELVPGARQDDDETFRFVFDRGVGSIDELVPTTQLEQVLVRHVRQGGHWRMRTGWLEL